MRDHPAFYLIFFAVKTFFTLFCSYLLLPIEPFCLIPHQMDYRNVLFGIVLMLPYTSFARNSNDRQ